MAKYVYFFYIMGLGVLHIQSSYSVLHQVPFKILASSLSCVKLYIYNAIKIATIKTSFRPHQNAFLLHLFQVVRTTLRRRVLPIRLAGSQLGAAEAKQGYFPCQHIYAGGQYMLMVSVYVRCVEVCWGVLDCTLFRSLAARYTSQLSMCHCLGRCADLLNTLVELGLVSVSGLICIQDCVHLGHDMDILFGFLNDS